MMIFNVIRGNRKNELFKCLQCGFTGHADHVGAINISERVPKDNPYLKLNILGGV